MNSINIALDRIDTSKLKLEVILIIDSPGTDFDFIRQEYSLGNKIAYTFIRNSENIGVAASRNKGFYASMGDFLLFIDQDDEIAPDFFNKFLKYSSDFNLIITNALLISKNKDFLWFYIKPKINLKNVIMKSIIRSPGQVIIKRDLFPEGGFPIPQKHFGSDDKFFWIKIFNQSRRLRIKYISQPLYHAFLHENNYSNNWKELAKSCVELWGNVNVNNNPDLLKIRERDILQQKIIIGDKMSIEDTILGRFYFIYNKYTFNNALRFLFKKLF